MSGPEEKGAFRTFLMEPHTRCVRFPLSTLCCDAGRGRRAGFQLGGFGKAGPAKLPSVPIVDAKCRSSVR